ncbi:MAG: hypothetical protein DDT35_01150 [Firmicutes bacterium]|nr:hypothetical protein [Bacillota bacterium]
MVLMYGVSYRTGQNKTDANDGVTTHGGHKVPNRLRTRVFDQGVQHLPKQ